MNELRKRHAERLVELAKLLKKKKILRKKKAKFIAAAATVTVADPSDANPVETDRAVYIASTSRLI